MFVSEAAVMLVQHEACYMSRDGEGSSNHVNVRNRIIREVGEEESRACGPGP